MSSHTNLSSPKPIPKPDHHISGSSQSRKPPSSSVQDQETLKCPRCNSPNTKFCYYNNYNLSQPRHFCKSCRRYWTRGGALRNVPIGGGCRKTKKAIKPNNTIITPSSSSSSHHRFFPSIMQDSFKYFPQTTTTTMDIQVFNNNNQQVLGLSRHMDQVETRHVDVGSGLSLMGFGDYNNNNHSPATFTTAGENVDGGNLATTSIETLSFLNQDLHWRLQQQRVAMIFGTNPKEEENIVAIERPQPILYRNLEFVNSSPSPPTKKGSNQTEWYFGNNSDDANLGGCDQWNNIGVQAWTDLNHYNANLP
ncbi:unnamed protein product [Cochlearia groenlandica]